MIDELGELNEKFYALYGKLFQNRNLLIIPEQGQFIAEKLLEEYKSEYERLKLRTEIDEERELYALSGKRGALIPDARRRHFRRVKNEAAQLIDREIQAEITEYFRRKEEALALLERKLDEEEVCDPYGDVAEEEREQSEAEEAETESAEESPAAKEEAGEGTEKRENTAQEQPPEPEKGSGQDEAAAILNS